MYPFFRNVKGIVRCSSEEVYVDIDIDIDGIASK